MTIKVNTKGGVYIEGHGQYNLGTSSVEDTVVKLALLKELCEHAIDDLAESGEILTPLSDKLERLANDMFKEYSHYIEHGCNIFNYKRWHDAGELKRYNKRDMHCGFMNATDEESVSGFELNPPKGWWLDHPDVLSKSFENFGVIVIDQDYTIRVGFYKHALDLRDSAEWLLAFDDVELLEKLPKHIQVEVGVAISWLRWYLKA